MDKRINDLVKGIEIDNDYLLRIKESKKTVQYLESEDFSKMPEKIKKMNEDLLKESKKNLEDISDNFIKFDTDSDGKDIVKYLSDYSETNLIEVNLDDIECYERILNSDNIVLTKNVKQEIEELNENKKEQHKKSHQDLRDHITNEIKKEFFNEIIPKKEQDIKPVVVQKVKPINYVIQKSNKSLKEIKEIVIDFLKKNEAIFDKIIFENKGVSLSITDRILDVYFKLGTGYVVNFISEPDTNHGKFYQNLLKVFNEVKEKIYLDHSIVVVPEEGKSLSYLNSFYQNYLFVREKLDTMLLQYKLQHSLLNENFSVKYLIFEKLSAKYLIYYNGNKDLVEAVEGYFQNQAKLGTMPFQIEYIEYDSDINTLIISRYEKRKNKIDLIDKNNYLKATNLCSDKFNESVLLDMTGAKILIDPSEVYEGDNLDVIVLTDSRKDKLNLIPTLMSRNPNAKLFTSDITYKVSRIKWTKMINSSVMGAGDAEAGFTKQDIENVNERVIRITPEGKGYNFKGIVNIKFFNAGCIPGASIVEIRDSGQNIIYLGNICRESSGLLKGADIDLLSYNYIFFKSAIDDKDKLSPIPMDQIKEKLQDGKQVFIFTDSIGLQQHILVDIYSAGVNYPIVSGDATFSLVNKEINKLLNFGSSWGDHFEDKELFIKSIQKVEPFIDEYEFYKKFSTDTPLVFLVPFDKAEVDMVIKNKVFTNNLIAVPTNRVEEYNSILEKTTSLMDVDDTKDVKPNEYNYITRTGSDEIFEITNNSSNLKGLVAVNEKFSKKNDKIVKLKIKEETEIY
ncbi:MAG: hypothetical protein KAS62_05105 [Candidatus Delongbacteria bacterium]|nr:hypothetical protein [Candidatus Delongbacteria bacterium]